MRTTKKADYALHVKGRSGEEKAGKHLKKLGYRIIEKNFRTRFGEIDIIAEDGEYLVFVEVKTRTSSRFANPEDYVDERKQRKILKSAQIYLLQYSLNERKCRFDVVSVSDTDKGAKVEVFKDAFCAEEC
ncbi:MAG: YraN family protein [Candidatus Schekmanbacteria bacterium]|nr:YraN family protein [Candidatus Schekmanbacteria bacterium]